MGKEEDWGNEYGQVMICYSENVLMEPTNREYVPIEN